MEQLKLHDKSQASKRCSGSCGRTLPLSSEYFHRDKKSPDGFVAKCKMCRRQDDSQRQQITTTEPTTGGRNSVGDRNDKPVATEQTTDEKSEIQPQTSPSETKITPATADDKALKTTDDRRAIEVFKEKLSATKAFVVFWLIVLFVGGFALSTLNGGYAFFDSAVILWPTLGVYIAGTVAGVLTLGTALTAYFGFIQKSSSALVMFILLQGLNLVINYTGVKKRLLITERKVQSEEIDAQISSLESLKRGYEDFINRYPPTNKTGRPVVWKQEITEAVLATQAKINVVNEKIRELKDKRPEIQKFDWLLLSAWLLVPELCLLSAILAFSVAGNRPFKKKKALPSWPN